MPSRMERLQSTVRSGRRTSTNSCSREVGSGSSSHDFGGDSRMIRRSSAEVTGVTVDRLKAVGGKTGGEEPSVSFRMLNSIIRLHKTKTPRNFIYISQEIYMLKSQNDVLYDS